MQGRFFNKISPALWSAASFIGLSDKAKIVFLYFCTNAHVTSAGCYVLPDGYACTDLHIDLETYRAIRAELIAARMIDFDPDHSVVLVEKWFKHNPPTNEKYAKGTSNRIADISSERLRQKSREAFEEADQARIDKRASDEAAKEDDRLRKTLERQSSRNFASHLTNTDYMQGKR